MTKLNQQPECWFKKKFSKSSTIIRYILFFLYPLWSWSTHSFQSHYKLKHVSNLIKKNTNKFWLSICRFLRFLDKTKNDAYATPTWKLYEKRKTRLIYAPYKYVILYLKIKYTKKSTTCAVILLYCCGKCIEQSHLILCNNEKQQTGRVPTQF